MTTERKVLLVILVAVFLVSVGIYWRSKLLINKIDNTSIALEDLEKYIASLNKGLGHLPPPTNGVTFSYHDGGYEDSWIQDIDKKGGVVLVTTIDSKMSIVFKPAVGDLQKFHINWIAPVTFQCTKFKNKKCDYDAPYKLFVSNRQVEVQQLIFPRKKPLK